MEDYLNDVDPNEILVMPYGGEVIPRLRPTPEVRWEEESAS